MLFLAVPARCLPRSRGHLLYKRPHGVVHAIQRLVHHRRVALADLVQHSQYVVFGEAIVGKLTHLMARSRARGAGPVHDDAAHS